MAVDPTPPSPEVAVAAVVAESNVLTLDDFGEEEGEEDEDTIGDLVPNAGADISPRLIALATKLDPRSIPDMKDPRARGRISQIVVENPKGRAHQLPRKSMMARRRPANKLDMTELEEKHAAIKNASEEKRVAAMAAHAIFHGFTTWQLRILAKLGKPSKFKKFSTIYRDGAIASCTYILTRGALEMMTTEGAITSIRVNDETSPHGICFGFEGLSMGESRRANTVTAIDDSDVLQFTLHGLTVQGVSMQEDWVQRLMNRSTELVVEKALRTMPLFEGLTAHVFRDLSAIFEVRECGSTGIRIFQQGDPGNKLFILLSGRVDVLKDGSKLVTLVADPHLPRPFFGEMALLDGSPRTASVVTAGPSRLLVLQHNYFQRFNALVPDFVARLGRIKKLREKHTEIMSASLASDPRSRHRSPLLMIAKGENVLQM